MVGMIASGRRKAAKLWKKAQFAVKFGAEDVAEVIYVDHYGNLVTRLRAGAVPRERAFVVNARQIFYARVFSQVTAGEVFWYENSLGLVEIAANAASAMERLGLRVGRPVELEPG
jgi:S-adenosylmethionine hydrolase